MRVTVNERFSIDIDNYGNHTLIEHGIGKSGKSAGQPTESTWGYYNSIATACKKIVDISVLDGAEQQTLAEYVNRYENATKTILDSLKGVLNK